MIRARARIWLGLAILVSTMTSLLLSPLRLLAQPHDERAVRVAYVFNLIHYVEWPPDKGDLLIGFIGSAAAGEVMQALLDGRTSESRKIRTLLNPSDDELQKCSIVYIADSKTSTIQSTIGKLKNKNSLTIGESETFARDGGMVGLVKVGDQIQIHVNLDATQRAGVKISSRVLSLAVIVRTAQNAKN